MKITEIKMRKVKEKFSAPELDLLQKAITGESICPRYLIIDPKKVPLGLQSKLQQIEKEIK